MLIARAELRARWLGILLIGFLAGLTGGVVIAACAVARRTATADQRLAAAAHADDVRGLVLGGTAQATLTIGQQVVNRPEVEEGRVALGGVARVEVPGIVYMSFIIGPPHWGDDVVSPVLSAGRLPRPDQPGEVVVNEAAARDGPVDIAVGDTLTLHLLTADEYPAFDARAPLEGRAGTQQVTVVGMVRVPGAPQDLPPFIATPAFARAQPEGTGVLAATLVRLRPGADVNAYIDGVNAIEVTSSRPASLAGLPAISAVSTAAQSRSATNTSTNVLTTGLVLLAAAGALAGGAAVAQAVVRHHAATAHTQRVEAAMGLTSTQRAQARLLAAIPSAILAVLLTIAIALACAGIGPPGALRTVEPNPGWAPNLALVSLSTLVVPAALLALVGVSARRAVRRTEVRGGRDSRLVSRLASLGGRPPSTLGLRFALERPPGLTGTSTRAAIATVAAGVTALLASSTFAASLDELVRTPVRYGYPTEIVISDAGPDVAAEFAKDDRFSTVITGQGADLLIDGRSGSATSQKALVGSLKWELEAGRPPVEDDEIVLGTRMAEELDKAIGDEVEVHDVAGGKHLLEVVGVGVVPNYGGRGLGRSAAVTVDALPKVASASAFGELALGVRPGVPIDDVLDELRLRYEVNTATPPREVSNLQQIDRVPIILGVFLGVLCLVTLGHAITMTARHRRRDLAIARSLGFVPRQSATSVIVMALTTTLTGLVIALPAGVLVGSFVWRQVAEGSALIGHVARPWIAVAAVLPIGAAVALSVAAVPARRAGRDRILYNLRPE